MTNANKHVTNCGISQQKQNLINSLTGSQASYKKVYFNEFVQNSLGCNMGMIIFDLRGTFGMAFVPQRLKNQSLYHEILLLQKFNDRRF
jgi:hypothetical protein